MESTAQGIEAKTTQAANLKRYKERTKQYHQNRMFESNCKRLYEEIDGSETGDETPNLEESSHFWNDTWGKSVFHNENAKWLKGSVEEIDYVKKQSNIKI